MRAVHDVQSQTSVTLAVHDIEFIRQSDSRLRYYSTISVIEPVGKTLSNYRKNILMPFGEYLPLEATFPSLRRWMPQARSILAGEKPEVLQAGEVAFAPSICFESLFPRYMSQVAVQNTGFIVNLTNDRWYGARQEPRQHLAFAQLRAIENRNPVARATNSGIAAFIDARGEITARTNSMERRWLRGSISPRTGHTFYAGGGAWLFPVVLTMGALGSIALAIGGKR
jgi:apolipoprotein N-acyltransferase